MFGKGKAPGSSQSYDATVYISDPALDARSLSVTVRSSNGTISSAANREIESAILSQSTPIAIKRIRSINYMNIYPITYAGLRSGVPR